MNGVEAVLGLLALLLFVSGRYCYGRAAKKPPCAETITVTMSMDTYKLLCEQAQDMS